jgi:hypothetical protein
VTSLSAALFSYERRRQGPNERLATMHVAHGGLPNVIPCYLALLAQPFATDRRQPVFLSLLLSAGHQTVIEQR